jgi:hypothetical protein
MLTPIEKMTRAQFEAVLRLNGLPGFDDPTPPELENRGFAVPAIAARR